MLKIQVLKASCSEEKHKKVTRSSLTFLLKKE